MDEIIPCPFCGVAPQKVRWGKVRCENPDCPIQPKNRSWWDQDHDAEAIAEWNTRAPIITTIAADTHPPGTTLTRDTLPLFDALDDAPDPEEDA